MKPATIVDQLGKVRAQIAELEAQESKLERQLIDATGDGPTDGKLFRAVVITQQYTYVDWHTVADRAQASRQLITAYSSQRERVQVRVTAR